MSDIEDVLIVGSGFAGLCAAIKLKEAGLRVRVLERDEALGGTWWANRYPGCACDVESHFYSFSFEPNPRFTRMFAPQREILEYMEHCADKYDVRKDIELGCGVTRATFDERAGHWEVETTDGKRRRARFVVTGTGGLSRPSVPELPGLSTFQGASWHSARWRDDYDLRGKNVAVIGTGASAIQIVPEIAKDVNKLYVFQRTPPWIVPRPDRAIGDTERALYERVPKTLQAHRLAIFAKREVFWLGFVPGTIVGKLGTMMAKDHLRRSIPDRALRERLRPHYDMGCKRILLSNDYYPTLLRPNVELVTSPIDRVEARGIRTTEGTARDLDAIILATGFQAAEAVAPFEVKGVGGRDLAETWANGAEAYLGTVVSGFPNLFMIVGPNTGLGHGSMIYMIESQVAYVKSAVETLRARGARTAEVRPEVQARYNAEIHAKLSNRVWATGGCASWYKTKSGKNTTLWPGTMSAFNLRTRRFDPTEFLLDARPQTTATATPEREALRAE